MIRLVRAAGIAKGELGDALANLPSRQTTRMDDGWRLLRLPHGAVGKGQPVPYPELRAKPKGRIFDEFDQGDRQAVLRGLRDR